MVGRSEGKHGLGSRAPCYDNGPLVRRKGFGHGAWATWAWSAASLELRPVWGHAQGFAGRPPAAYTSPAVPLQRVEGARLAEGAMAQGACLGSCSLYWTRRSGAVHMATGKGRHDAPCP